MKDAVRPPRTTASQRFARSFLAVVALGFVVAYFPVRGCPRCAGTGALPIEASDEVATCWSCSGHGWHTLLDVLWPVWGA